MTLRPKVNYMIGADPELFLVDKAGKFVSAHDLIPGSKESPFEVLKGALQPDGTAAEFNINPAVTSEEFMDNIRSVLNSLQFTLNSKNPELSLKVQPTAHFESGYFKTLPQSALAFGCTPDFDAYTAKMNEFKGTTKPMRTGAGHVHVGWTNGELPHDKAHYFDCCEAVKQLDCVLYFGSLLWDADAERRELYGKIGAFRPKSYGVEYRSISNAWVADPDLQKWVFEATTKAMELLDTNDERLWEEKSINDMVEDVRAGVDPTWGDLFDLHEDLVTFYDIPRLPDAYLNYVPF